MKTVFIAYTGDSRTFKVAESEEYFFPIDLNTIRIHGVFDTREAADAYLYGHGSVRPWDEMDIMEVPFNPVIFQTAAVDDKVYGVILDDNLDVVKVFESDRIPWEGREFREGEFYDPTIETFYRDGQWHVYCHARDHEDACKLAVYELRLEEPDGPEYGEDEWNKLDLDDPELDLP